MEIKLPARSHDAFETLLQRSNSMIKEALHAPVREVVAIKNPSGGYEIRTQLVQSKFLRKGK